MKENNLGTAGNSIAGILGGGAGAAILRALGVAAANGGTTDLGGILANVAGGGVGGAILMAVIGLIRQAATKKA